MKLVRHLTAAVVAVGLAAAALAAGEPKPVVQDQPLPSGPATAPLAADPAAGLADIPENQAELAAIKAGELKLVQPEGTAPAPTVDAAREARRAAFAAVIAEQDAKIEALAARLAGASAESSLDIQKQIEAEKRATDRRLLEVQIELATAAGDQAATARVQAALEAFDAPAPAGQPVDRPVPANQGR